MSRASLVRLLLRGFALLPLPVAHGVGAALGWLLSVVPNSLRRTSETNLRLCLPEVSADRRRRLVRRSLVETGKTAAESGAVWLWPPERVMPLVRETVNERLMEDAVAAGRGVILATPHLGSWEMAGLHASVRFGITSLYRPPRMAELETLLRRARERTGARLVPTDAGGIRALYHALGRGEVMGILPDQEPAPGAGVFAPWFGVPAYTMSLLSRLARKTGAPVIFIYAERLPFGRGFRLHYRGADPAVASADPREAAAALNRSVEACVRALPAQYQWSYRRFRTRPDGQAPVYT
ncbi:MAG TPA: lysophospholipid acyltransferase family protein [Gammaproteobacteria bacterium]|nr:lysophospholipid acyltransferase family protein [Gammaproteobacteria bacterium]